jgi:iron complex transport system permease protein
MVTLACAAGLLSVMAGSLLFGVESASLTRALSDPTSIDAAIIATRLPRAVLGALVGMALAPSGVAFQALLRNPLADPYVLGVSGGAAVAGTMVIVLGLASGPLGGWTLPVWAFGGALAAIAVVFAVGRVRGRLIPNQALLTGVVVNAFSGSLVVAMRLLTSPTKSHEALYWLSGALTTTIESWKLLVVASYVILGLAVLLRMSVAMNAFALGDEAAHVVGVDTERARKVIFLAASLLTGAAVAFAGPIGFVGIVVPHVLRGVLGPDHRLLIPTSALAGGAFLVLCDTVSRLAFLEFGTEPTVGVVTAFCGAPFFLWVLRRRGAERMF